MHVYIIHTGIRTTHTEFGGRATGDFTAIDDGTEPTTDRTRYTRGWNGGWCDVRIAKQVMFHAVPVLGCNGRNGHEVIAGVDWVTANHVSRAVGT